MSHRPAVPRNEGMDRDVSRVASRSRSRRPWVKYGCLGTLGVIGVVALWTAWAFGAAWLGARNESVQQQQLGQPIAQQAVPTSTNASLRVELDLAAAPGKGIGVVDVDDLGGDRATVGQVRDPRELQP